MVSLKAPYLRPVFLHSDQVMFLLLLVAVVLKASYFRERGRIHPWRCRAGNSSVQTDACRPAVCTEHPRFQRAAQPEGPTPGRPVRCSRGSSAPEQSPQHGPCSAGSASGRAAEPTQPWPPSAQHPAARKGCAVAPGAEPGAPIPRA